MSTHCLFEATLMEPAEYESDNSDDCFVCGQDHDLDDSEDFRIVEGLPAGWSIICTGCDLVCSVCDTSILEGDKFSSDVTVKDGVTWNGTKPVCGDCVIEELWVSDGRID